MAGGSFRASDADREQVMAVLSTAFAEGRISHEEHDERLQQAAAAKTFDDLIPITHDLVVVPSTAQAVAAADTSYLVDLSGGSEQPDLLVAVFGGVTRKGRWRIRRQSRALAVFGGMDLDLRDAIFEDKVVEISGIWCFGGMEVKVPAGINVQDHVAGVFGGSDVSSLGQHQPGAPTLVIKGLALFGGVSVKGPKPPEKRR